MQRLDVGSIVNAISDRDVRGILEQEGLRQERTISMLASENMLPLDGLLAQASPIANKTVEGFPGHRYHAGAAWVDALERLCIDRGKELFAAGYANVQPHSGSQANQVVFNALLDPGDRLLSMRLSDGGHLSHGAAINQSGKLYDVSSYGVDRETGLIDYDEFQRIARERRPKLIVAGGSAYPRIIDFKAMAAIAAETGALLLVDMAHFAGQVAAGRYPNPVPLADVVSTTTYKSLRGPRGGMILSRSKRVGRLVDRSLFPGFQGTPAMHQVAAKAICLGEARQPAFGDYIERALRLAAICCSRLQADGFRLLTGGTDTTMVMVDLSREHFTGRAAAEALERCGIIANQNAIPGDFRPPFEGSGLRLSTTAMAARGFDAATAAPVFDVVCGVLDSLRRDRPIDVADALRRIARLCDEHPAYAVNRQLEVA
ncbi:serine hydroxymethyltransferase [Caulobacter sp. KR2-114]|uniref:serine hydroxymethyltransferase n=1 Tax=Caulobacter sp. KR2-114 TaxID=3400912 RepID=UPI003C0A68F7